jgi:hypothetical protein
MPTQRSVEDLVIVPIVVIALAISKAVEGRRWHQRDAVHGHPGLHRPQSRERGVYTQRVMFHGNILFTLSTPS